MPDPRFSVSQITTLPQTYEQDLATYAEAGAEGIGIWEFKLAEGDDKEAVARLRDSGLQATTCIPATLSIYPIPLPGPADPRERLDELCAGIRRLAAFEPQLILCLTGYPGDGADASDARRVIVDGLRKAARTAAEYGLPLGLEPLHRRLYGTWSIVNDIPSAIELMDEVDEPNVRLLYDVYHLWDTPDLIDHTLAHADRIWPSIHVCDWREETRNDFDRTLPGEGIIDLPAIFGALEAGNAISWFDLEIFSDDGTFTDQSFEDSHWKEDGLEVCRRGRAGVERAWAARRSPS